MADDYPDDLTPEQVWSRGVSELIHEGIDRGLYAEMRAANPGLFDAFKRLLAEHHPEFYTDHLWRTDPERQRLARILRGGGGAK